MMPRRTLLQVEELGARLLPGVAPLALPGAPVAAIHPPQQPEHFQLAGHGGGDYTAVSSRLDPGTTYRLQGSADLAGLGPVTVAGSVSAVGFVQHGHAAGSLTFANARGSVTVQLQGPEQPGFSPLPQAFAYRVVGGTGAFQRLTSQGTLQLALRAGPVAQHGTFTLSF
jgi:hypothetical protein